MTTLGPVSERSERTVGNGGERRAERGDHLEGGAARSGAAAVSEHSRD
jgi:hypothetical protein